MIEGKYARVLVAQWEEGDRYIITADTPERITGNYAKWGETCR